MCPRRDSNPDPLTFNVNYLSIERSRRNTSQHNSLRQPFVMIPGLLFETTREIKSKVN